MAITCMHFCIYIFCILELIIVFPLFVDLYTPALKMTGELGKKAETPSKRVSRSDLQALHEQFAAQLKSPEERSRVGKEQQEEKETVGS